MFKREEVNRKLPVFEIDDSTNDKVKLSEAEKLLLFKVQQGNDWPVSPRAAKLIAEQNKLFLPPIQQTSGIDPQMWNHDYAASNASDWNALPWEKNSKSFVLDSSLSSQLSPY